MMTHKEALRVAQNAFFMHRPCNMEAAIRTYIEALGLVLVPREPTMAQFEAGEDCGIRAYTGTVTYAVTSVYSAMLAAAPDPFAQKELA